MIDVGRVAVIGTGVVGACIGYYLAREGTDVMLVDAGQPGQVTTSASFAWVNASAKAGNPPYFELNFAGIREYERLVEDFAGATWWNHTGHLRWDYRDELELVQSVEQLHALGYPAEVWEAERAGRLLEPHVAFASPSALTVWFPSEGWVDGPGMVKTLVDAAVRRGATTAFADTVRAVHVTNRAVASIELASGEKHPVRKIVNAAGPGAASIAALVGRALPMQVRPGLAVRVETTQTWVNRVIHAPDVSIRPDGAGRVFVSARSVEPELSRPGYVATELAEQVKRLAIRVVPELADAPVVDARIGHRPIPIDGLPMLGKASDVDGYYEAVTHSGITLGPIVARALTGEILSGDVDPLVRSFRAGRL